MPVFKKAPKRLAFLNSCPEVPCKKFRLIPGLKKLSFLVHESPCFSKKVQENVVCLVILCTL